MPQFLFLLAAAFAETGDTQDSAPDSSPECGGHGSYVDGICVDDWEKYCSAYCSTWGEFLENPPYSTEFFECQSGGSAAFMAVSLYTEYGVWYYFNQAGEMIGVVKSSFNGDWWCCEGHETSGYKVGITGECIPIEDSAESAPLDPPSVEQEDTGGCARKSPLALLFLFPLLLRRKQGPDL